MGGAWDTYGEKISHRVWWENLREREELCRPRSKWNDNIKMVLKTG
jgi:hypothetical protein